ncbi:conserved Plasmodium protein, unknown function [Plasmodium berghei]|uniref:Uncharacterized protein n=1 Tax=Plasmodium berghei TaxID=5821 RepID=A0A0Y9Y4D7_PLABE|nr:conserved Plasmodium protein, unknown function [Plasmodium berghei]SCO61484.1 conserved Plasmodium protein, unknown function [Plasmodium berghei]
MKKILNGGKHENNGNSIASNNFKDGIKKVKKKKKKKTNVSNILLDQFHHRNKYNSNLFSTGKNEKGNLSVSQEQSSINTKLAYSFGERKSGGTYTGYIPPLGSSNSNIMNVEWCENNKPDIRSGSINRVAKSLYDLSKIKMNNASNKENTNENYSSNYNSSSNYMNHYNSNNDNNANNNMFNRIQNRSGQIHKKINKYENSMYYQKSPIKLNLACTKQLNKNRKNLYNSTNFQNNKMKYVRNENKYTKGNKNKLSYINDHEENKKNINNIVINNLSLPSDINSAYKGNDVNIENRDAINWNRKNSQSNSSSIYNVCGSDNKSLYRHNELSNDNKHVSDTFFNGIDNNLDKYINTKNEYISNKNNTSTNTSGNDLGKKESIKSVYNFIKNIKGENVVEIKDGKCLAKSNPQKVDITHLIAYCEKSIEILSSKLGQLLLANDNEYINLIKYIIDIFKNINIIIDFIDDSSCHFNIFGIILNIYSYLCIKMFEENYLLKIINLKCFVLMYEILIKLKKNIFNLSCVFTLYVNFLKSNMEGIDVLKKKYNNYKPRFIEYDKKIYKKLLNSFLTIFAYCSESEVNIVKIEALKSFCYILNILYQEKKKEKWRKARNGGRGGIENKDNNCIEEYEEEADDEWGNSEREENAKIEGSVAIERNMKSTLNDPTNANSTKPLKNNFYYIYNKDIIINCIVNAKGNVSKGFPNNRMIYLKTHNRNFFNKNYFSTFLHLDYKNEFARNDDKKRKKNVNTYWNKNSEQNERKQLDKEESNNINENINEVPLNEENNNKKNSNNSVSVKNAKNKSKNAILLINFETVFNSELATGWLSNKIDDDDETILIYVFKIFEFLIDIYRNKEIYKAIKKYIIFFLNHINNNIFSYVTYLIVKISRLIPIDRTFFNKYISVLLKNLNKDRRKNIFLMLSYSRYEKSGLEVVLNILSNLCLYNFNFKTNVHLMNYEEDNNNPLKNDMDEYNMNTHLYNSKSDSFDASKKNSNSIDEQEVYLIDHMIYNNKEWYYIYSVIIVLSFKYSDLIYPFFFDKFRNKFIENSYINVPFLNLFERSYRFCYYTSNKILYDKFEKYHITGSKCVNLFEFDREMAWGKYEKRNNKIGENSDEINCKMNSNNNHSYIFMNEHNEQKKDNFLINDKKCVDNKGSSDIIPRENISPELLYHQMYAFLEYPQCVNLDISSKESNFCYIYILSVLNILFNKDIPFFNENCFFFKKNIWELLHDQTNLKTNHFLDYLIIFKDYDFFYIDNSNELIGMLDSLYYNYESNYTRRKGLVKRRKSDKLSQCDSSIYSSSDSMFGDMIKNLEGNKHCNNISGLMSNEKNDEKKESTNLSINNINKFKKIKDFEIEKEEQIVDESIQERNKRNMIYFKQSYMKYSKFISDNINEHIIGNIYFLRYLKEIFSHFQKKKNIYFIYSYFLKTFITDLSIYGIIHRNSIANYFYKRLLNGVLNNDLIYGNNVTNNSINWNYEHLDDINGDKLGIKFFSKYKNKINETGIIRNIYNVNEYFENDKKDHYDKHFNYPTYDIEDKRMDFDKNINEVDVWGENGNVIKNCLGKLSNGFGNNFLHDLNYNNLDKDKIKIFVETINQNIEKEHKYFSCNNINFRFIKSKIKIFMNEKDMHEWKSYTNVVDFKSKYREYFYHKKVININHRINKNLVKIYYLFNEHYFHSTDISEILRFFLNKIYDENNLLFSKLNKYFGKILNNDETEVHKFKGEREYSSYVISDKMENGKNMICSKNYQCSVCNQNKNRRKIINLSDDLEHLVTGFNKFIHKHVEQNTKNENENTYTINVVINKILKNILKHIKNKDFINYDKCIKFSFKFVSFFFVKIYFCIEIDPYFEIFENYYDKDLGNILFLLPDHVKHFFNRLLLYIEYEDAYYIKNTQSEVQNCDESKINEIIKRKMSNKKMEQTNFLTYNFVAENVLLEDSSLKHLKNINKTKVKNSLFAKRKKNNPSNQNVVNDSCFKLNPKYLNGSNDQHHCGKSWSNKTNYSKVNKNVKKINMPKYLKIDTTEWKIKRSKNNYYDNSINGYIKPFKNFINIELKKNIEVNFDYSFTLPTKCKVNFCYYYFKNNKFILFPLSKVKQIYVNVLNQ